MKNAQCFNQPQVFEQKNLQKTHKFDRWNWIEKNTSLPPTNGWSCLLGASDKKVTTWIPKLAESGQLSYGWWEKSCMGYYLQGFIHVMWCRISSINSITYLWTACVALIRLLSHITALSIYLHHNTIGSMINVCGYSLSGLIVWNVSNDLSLESAITKGNGETLSFGWVKTPVSLCYCVSVQLYGIDFSTKNTIKASHDSCGIPRSHAWPDSCQCWFRKNLLLLKWVGLNFRLSYFGIPFLGVAGRGRDLYMWY